jgi:hypothetical protein
MSDINTLLNQIQASITLANQLSKDPSDNFAACISSLQAAMTTISASENRSSVCKCPCHSGNTSWHAFACGCYTGNPQL